MIERRKTQRHQVSVPVSGWISNARLFEGVTRDVSTDGVYVWMNRAIEPGEPLVFLMRFPATFPDNRETLLWAYCKAVRVESNAGEDKYPHGVAAVTGEYSMTLRDSAITRLVSQTVA